MAIGRRSRGDGALFFVESKQRWVGRVVVDGRRRTVSATTKTEALGKLRKLRAEVDAGLPASPGDLTLGAVLEQWEAKALANRSISPSTRDRHRWAARVMREEIGTTKLRTLSPDHIEAALERRARNGLAKASLVKLRATLRQALTWAVRRRLIAWNPASVAELPVAARAARLGKAMTVKQAQDFLRAAEGTPLAAMWTAALHLGCRPGEVAGLAWADIDFDSGVIHIWRSRTRDERGAAVIGATKNPQSIRSLDAPRVVLDALAVHRKAQSRQRLAVGPAWTNTDGLCFVSPSGRPTDPAAVRKEFDRVVQAAGLRGSWVPNELRHSAASLMADAGMPIERVADQLGHRDLRMLQKHYRHRVRPTIDGGTVLGAVLDEA